MTTERQMKFRKRAEKLLRGTGVKLIWPGSRTPAQPWDIVVHNEDLYERVFSAGSLGLGEAYMDGWWDCEDLSEMFSRVLRANIQDRVSRNLPSLWLIARYHLLNLQAGRRAAANAKAHYDIGNDLYEPMLGPTMAYSCGYWYREGMTLDEAQRAKLELICQKLKLPRKGSGKPMTVLDIGCGWGSFLFYAVEHYNVTVVGITPAEEQVAYINARIKNEGVGNVRVVQTDSHSFARSRRRQRFDRIVSVGMFEHVGPKNYRQFFEDSNKLLADNGLMLLHTIGNEIPTQAGDPWIDRYIFPGGVIPSNGQIAAAHEGILHLEDLHNFSAHYDPTLMSWHDNYEKARSQLDHDKYSEREHRKQEYYLLQCAGMFRARRKQLFQYVFSKDGMPGGYKSVRDEIFADAA
ncbi:cyclopropane fatty acyl phospholipid synthase [Candidatus Saccharibacteria bacterium]|nr:cyclopropane fatty acyl phospholipid synthase [Candidatus Saccharibacteria bacterium]